MPQALRMMDRVAGMFQLLVGMLTIQLINVRIPPMADIVIHTTKAHLKKLLIGDLLAVRVLVDSVEIGNSVSR